MKGVARKQLDILTCLSLGFGQFETYSPTKATPTRKNLCRSGMAVKGLVSSFKHCGAITVVFQSFLKTWKFIMFGATKAKMGSYDLCMGIVVLDHFGFQ